jgi:hypothetical protein
MWLTQIRVHYTIINMEKIFRSIALLFVTTFILFFTANAQTSAMPMPVLGPANPWTASNLLEPSVLADQVKSGTEKRVIFNIGAVEDIQGATHIGPVSNPENLSKLKMAIVGLPRTTAIVIYCGCCPFAKCPNIRPAFSLLQKEGFVNIKLLNLTKNLQTDWIAKGYPLSVK